jgi:hypothetical protein
MTENLRQFMFKTFTSARSESGGKKGGNILRLLTSILPSIRKMGATRNATNHYNEAAVTIIRA